ncbi:MAG: hemolysin activation/secretion protein [Halopseudomonas sp.]|jgi:hemolysin activation/secretion protein|uniref:ShlB/FhaC/HecB family hemolysin secretion/activation protein n=1 Tax=Halopseudomonas sp. TaxID=2901191 RepID=UPI0039E4F18F
MIKKIGRTTSLFCITFGLLCSSPLSAANLNDINDAVRQQQQIQQEQQLRLQLQYEEDLKSSRPPANLSPPLEEIKPSITNGICIQVNEIQMEGVEKLKPKDFKSLLKAYESTCMNVGDIERLMAEVTAIYLEKGFITTRVYLAKQDLQGGILVLQIVEGLLEGISINDNNTNSISIMNVYPGVIGEPLNLRDIEQTIDQINRLQSNNVTMSITPGKTIGTSVLTLTNKTKKRWGANLGYDNYGQESTGQDQATGNLTLDNPFGFNDFISISHNRTTPYDGSERGSKSNSLTYVVPLGYSTFSINGSESNYSSPLMLASGNSLKSSGTSQNLSLRLDRTLFRDRSSKWSVSSTVNNKDSKNYLDDNFLSISSRKLSNIDLDLTYTKSYSIGTGTVSIGHVKGVDWFGALKDEADLPTVAPQAQFNKWKYAGSFSSNFNVKNKTLIASSRLTGQYAEDVLFGSEALLIGGIYTVRGFSSNSLSGESGFYVRNDLTLPINTAAIAGLTSSLRVYTGLDYGQVSNNSKNVPDGSLSGAALGMTLSIASLNIDVNTSKAIKKPNYMTDEGYISYVRIGIAF